MWELDCEESWPLKNWCFWTVLLEKTLESPLDYKEIQPVHSKGDQPWVFFGRNDAKAETPVLWPPHVKSWLIGKDSDPGRDWGQEEKGTTENEMAEWHHGLDGRESEWTPGVGDGQGGLACCDSWGRKESDTTEWLNWTELKFEYASLQILASLDFDEKSALFLWRVPAIFIILPLCLLLQFIICISILISFSLSYFKYIEFTGYADSCIEYFIKFGEISHYFFR